ncbi:MAG TPA: stage II sporulation protein P [Syntrophomonadaceae bacterium]|nr:stage II sporulation protein P [Syntrophomonadaceae bacterium]
MDRIKTHRLWSFIKTILLLQVFVVCLLVGVSQEKKLYLPAFNLKPIFNPLSLMAIDSDSASRLLKHVNIVMAGQEEEAILVAGYFNNVPEKFLQAHIRALEDCQVLIPQATKPVIEPIELPAIVRNDISPSPAVYNFNAEDIVMFYCTHSAETYIPNSGRAKLDGERGLINDVANRLAGAIANRGLKTRFINTIHDYPEYNKSYVNSRETIKEIVKNKNTLAVFDVHRDSIPGSTNAYTIDIDHKKAARILIIVGTDERKAHDNWQKNLEFAQKLYEKGEILYPGLIKGVRTKAGTYNQEYHPRALLLEIGNDQNNLDEAEYAADLLADILIEVLKEEVE